MVAASPQPGCDGCGGALCLMPRLARQGCHECSDCGLVVCLPLPDDPGAQYGADYFDRRRELTAADISWKVDAFRDLAKALRRSLGQGARVLEVGSGVGALVRALRDQGLEATGLELSEAAVAIAREHLGIELRQESVDEAQFPHQLDGIVALHVVEHLLSPNSFIEKASAALRMGGLLVVEVPDFGARLRERTGDDWPYFRPGEHLFHFTEGSLRWLMTQHGLAVSRVERLGGLGVLAREAQGAVGWRKPKGVAGTLFASRLILYRIPGVRRVTRWVNRMIGYDVLRRHAHIRLWAERVA